MEIIYVSVGILIDSNNNILVEKNSSNSNINGYWQFPGGKIEKGETPLMALKREMKEELNIDIKWEKTEPFCFIEATNSSECCYVVFFYICKEWENQANANINQELQWCSINKLLQLKFLPNNFDVLEKLKTLDL